jgi:hypothetical protein
MSIQNSDIEARVNGLKVILKEFLLSFEQIKMSIFAEKWIF